MYENDFEEDGISLLDLIKVSIGTKRISRIRFCIIVIIILIATYLAVGVFYNNSKADYVASFQYQIPSLIQKENKDGIVSSVSYLDGTPFNVNSLVSLENLKNVKESSNNFSNIDVDKMFDNTDINASFNGLLEYQYSVSIKKKYFKNEAQAKSFVSALVYLPLATSKELVEATDNSLYLEQATSEGMTLTNEIKNLINQANHISNTYNSLVSTASHYGKTKVLIDNKLVDINELKVVAQSKIDTLSLSLYLNEVEANHYVRNYSNQMVKDEIQNTYNNLLAEQAELEQKINNYNSMIQKDTMINANYANYINCMDRKVEVDYSVEVYKGYIDYGIESPTFEAKLSNVVSILKDITDEMTEVQKEIYQEDLNTIFYQYNSVVFETGTMSTLLILVIGVVLGIVLAAIVNLIFGYNTYKNDKYSSSIDKTLEAQEEPKAE